MEKEHIVVDLIEELIDLKLGQRFQIDATALPSASNAELASDTSKRLEVLRIRLATAIDNLFKNA
jgi:hypothetical protein